MIDKIFQDLRIDRLIFKDGKIWCVKNEPDLIIEIPQKLKELEDMWLEIKIDRLVFTSDQIKPMTIEYPSSLEELKKKGLDGNDKM